jgi:hypothetical protein
MTKKTEPDRSRPPTADELDERVRVPVDDPEEALRALLNVKPDDEPTKKTKD